MKNQCDDQLLWDRFAGDQGPAEFIRYTAEAGQTIREAVTEGVAEWLRDDPEGYWAEGKDSIIDQLVRYLERRCRKEEEQSGM